MLVADHPVLLELFKGSMSGMVTMGAKSRIGEASIVVAVLAAIPGLMIFDWIYWWAGRRWGRNAIDLFLGNHPKAAARAARIERIFHRFGWIAIVVAYFQPIPNVLDLRRRRLDADAPDPVPAARPGRLLLWIALCVGLGYAIGQSAVDVAKAVGALRAVGHDRPGGRDRRPPDVDPAPLRLDRTGDAHRPLTIVARTSPNDTLPARAADHDRRRRRPGTAGRARSASPRCPASAPEIVPLANRSPGRTAAPLTVAWASCCGNVQ